MKAKVMRGKGFRGAASYLLGEDKDAKIVGGTMSGESPNELSREFAETRQLRPETQRPVWHHSLSLPLGESLSQDKWQDVASEYMQRLADAEGVDPDAVQWVGVRHGDTEHDHVHILASRITADGELIHGKFEAKKAIQATQEIEQSQGLTATPGPEAGAPAPGKAPEKKPSNSEIGRARRSEDPPEKSQARQAIDAAIVAADGDFELFVDALDAAGVELLPNIASTGRLNGVAFEYEGVYFKASQLGKSYSWSQLAERVGYAPEQHAELMQGLQRASQGAYESHRANPGPSSRRGEPAHEADRAGDTASARSGGRERAAVSGDDRADSASYDAARRRNSRAADRVAQRNISSIAAAARRSGEAGVGSRELEQANETSRSASRAARAANEKTRESSDGFDNSEHSKHSELSRTSDNSSDYHVSDIVEEEWNELQAAFQADEDALDEPDDGETLGHAPVN